MVTLPNDTDYIRAILGRELKLRENLLSLFVSLPQKLFSLVDSALAFGYQQIMLTEHETSSHFQ